MGWEIIIYLQYGFVYSFSHFGKLDLQGLRQCRVWFFENRSIGVKFSWADTYSMRWMRGMQDIAEAKMFLKEHGVDLSSD